MKMFYTLTPTPWRALPTARSVPAKKARHFAYFGIALLIVLIASLGLAPAARAAETVIISEFMASNHSTLLDEDGDSSDWIEIYNSGGNTVNLGGWYLTDNAADLTKWTFPATNLSPNSFLVVFASGKNRAVAGAPLHTSFNLSSGGDYLALVHPDGTTIATEFAPAYPQQYDDISYGFVQTLSVTKLVSNTSPVRVLIPTNGVLGTTWLLNSFSDSSWIAATNGVGYESSVPGFAMRNYKANVQVTTLAVAEGVISTPSQQSAAYAENRNVVNYLNTGAAANFGGDSTFPGFTINVDQDDFVLEATGTITIPAAGNWSFGVNSDDGFKLTIGSFLEVCDCQRGPTDTIQSFNFPAAGDYPLRLVFFERAGGAEVELFAAQGNFTTYGQSAAWRLVGDTANGGLPMRSLPVSSGGSGTSLNYRSFIATDVQSRMLSNNASAFIRLPFTVANPATLSTLTLQMKYDDGFVAYLNGTEIARRNAPASPQWNSTATASHPNAQAVVSELIDVTPFLGALQSGANMLAVQGLNDSLTGTDFLIVAELGQFQSTFGTNQYFATPTPGTFNSTNAFYAKVGDTKFSHDRGFYFTNFSLSITSGTAAATIRYTLNGSVPSLTNGFTYTAPILITNTTVLRAAAFKTGLNPTDVDTETYIFLNDVIRQANEVAPGPGWPAERKATGSGQVNDYGMDPQVVTNPVYSATIINDLQTIPSYSIVMELKDLFDGTTGIYENPGGDTIAWERPGSIELIYPDGTKGFQINGGIRIRGGYSRSPDNPKHAFRFFFRQEYGQSNLKFPVFGTTNGAPGEFQKYDLRTMQNYSWSFGGDSRMICLRDQWNRDTQLAMGQQGERGDFYHLYINGQYWGLYNTDERAEANFGAAYFGGQQEEYDCIKVSPDDGYIIYATDGNMDAWTRLWRQATNGLSTDAAYQKVQGNNPDGTRNPAYENLIDVDNMIDYMLVIYYGGNLDAPISNFIGNTSPNNFFSVRNTNGTAGFRFFAHDSEHTLLNVGEDRTGPYPAGDPVSGGGLLKSNPQWFFQQMWGNAELRLRVADHVQKHFFNGGALTPQQCVARFMVRSNEIQRAVVAESARWGDAKREPPLTRNVEWLSAMADVVNNFFPTRTAVVINQLKGKGLYPSLSAPILNQFGGSVPAGFSLTLSNANATGVIYYTLDGSDPRLIGGAIAPGAITYTAPLTLNRVTFIRTRIKDGANWSALVETTIYVQQDFTKLFVSELMYNPPAVGLVSGDEFEFLELKNAFPKALDLSGLFFSDGITFTFTNGSSLAPGQFFVLARNAAQFQSKYPGVPVNGIYTGKLDNGGEVIALSHVLGTKVFSFTYDDTAPWPIAPDGNGFSLVSMDPNANPDPDNPGNWRASSALGGSPGADDPAPAITPILINEILTHTDLPQVDAIELFNPTGIPVDLGGWFLTDDANTPKKFRIPDNTMIAAHGFKVFDENDFNPTPGTNNSFSFSSHGDEAYLLSGDSHTNLTGYSRGVIFGPAANGVSFGRYVNSVGEEQFPAQVALTLNATNAGPKVGPVVINEIMYHPALDFDEFIELKNITGTPAAMYDPDHPTNTWRLNGVGFSFPTNVTIPPNGFLILSSVDPALFRAKYNVPAAAQILGPYPGTLQDSGERLELQRPDVPDTNGLFYITVDEVRYNDKAPWPVAADGDGPSLQRLVATAYGNDPTNWFTSGITPGGANVFNRAPGVSMVSPTNGSIFAGPTNLVLQATAADSDGSILKVEFFENGVKLGETTSTSGSYVFNWLSVGPGSYALTARATDNGFSTSNSQPLMITVTPPPAGNGLGLKAEYYNNRTLTAPVAVTTTNQTVNYDWGTGTPGQPGIGADNFSVRWTGMVQPRYSGTYTFYTTSDDGVRLWVSNNITPLIDNWTDHGATENAGNIDLVAGQLYNIRMEFYENGGGALAKLAWSAAFVPKEIIPQSQLYPFYSPSITTQPVAKAAAVGTSTTFTVGATGSAPLNYQWRFNGGPIPNAVLTNSSLILTNIQLSAAGGYSVVVTNPVGSVTSVVATLTVGTPAQIVSQPQSQTVLQGETVTLSVTATGDAPLFYRWSREGVTLINFSNGLSSLTLTNVQLVNTGRYNVRITNLFLPSSILSSNAFLNVLADSNTNHIADEWETRYGFDLNDPGVSAADPDGDTMSNYQEYIAGTDPLDGNSYLRIDATGTAAGNGTLLSFIAVSNKTYTVLSRDALESGPWQRLTNYAEPAPTNRVLVLTNAPLGVRKRFYRLVTPQLP